VAYFSQLKGFRLFRASADNLDLNERIIAESLIEDELLLKGGIVGALPSRCPRHGVSEMSFDCKETILRGIFLSAELFSTEVSGIRKGRLVLWSGRIRIENEEDAGLTERWRER
jgi:hypothetical protein